ncbi:MAG: ABC transporter permease [Cytophagales bacterium]|nr:ABC transporter permease [Cytophagales bacterium]
MKINPPQRALQFLRWFCREDYLEEIEGDLIEVFEIEVQQSSKRAKWKFAWSVIKYFRPEFIKSFKHKEYNAYGMYKSYFKIGWRNLAKNKGYSLINIGGLAIGLAACMLIGLYVHHELSYDQFNEKADRIYRADMEIKFGDNHMNIAVTNPTFGETALSDFAQIEQTTRLRFYGGFLVKKGDVNIREGNVAWADSTLFDVFTLPVIAGNPKTALTEPNSIVLTESVARKYFDKTDVVGQTLTINNTETRKITAVIKDIPSNAHFHFTSFIPNIEDKSASQDIWAGYQNWNTYLLLKPGVDPNTMTTELNRMLDRHLEPDLKKFVNKSLAEFNNQGDFFKVSLTKLTDIHLHSDKPGELYANGNMEYIYIFSVIAVFILFIAIINFMNLATARSANRAREVGVRKVMGSLRHNLIHQFLTESFLTCLFAMLLSVGITYLSLPLFNELTGKSFDFSFLGSGSVIFLMIGLTLVVGLLSGSYPAFYLSAFQPVAVLRGSKGYSKKSVFRNTLVAFQFSASILLIAGTLIVFLQMEYIRSKDLGYSRAQKLIINNIDQLGQQLEPFKNNLTQVAGVEGLSVTGFLPVNFNRSVNAFFPSPTMDINTAISIQSWIVDENYLPTMDMKVVAGRNFHKGKADTLSIILNEAAAKFLGWGDVLEHKLYRLTEKETSPIAEYNVIGIVKDFHFSSLREQVKPLAFLYGEDRGGLTVKVNSTDMASVINNIEAQWKSISPGFPFEYSFMDQDFENLYKSERQIGNLITIFASLSIFISCLGLFGLATYVTEQRTKEIGIRKVLGASVAGITTLLSKDFLKIVLIAIVIATPVAYYLTYQWLQGFVYRISLQWWVFVGAGLIALGIALFTISFQAIKAALANPVKSLRSE